MRKKERSINTVLVAARDRMIYLLGRNIEGNSPEINTPEVINAGDDQEDTRAPGSTLQQATQSEDDGSLVFLDVDI